MIASLDLATPRGPRVRVRIWYLSGITLRELHRAAASQHHDDVALQTERFDLRSIDIDGGPESQLRSGLSLTICIVASPRPRFER